MINLQPEVLVCAFNSEGFVLSVNKSNSLELPRGSILQGETQRQAAVRTLKEQTGFDVQPKDMFALYYDKLTDNSSSACVLGYLCTKVLEIYDQYHYLYYGSDYSCAWQTTASPVNDFVGYMSTQKFLSNCSYQNYHETVLCHASTVSEQMKLTWSTQAKKTAVESKPETQPKKDPKMKTNTKTPDNTPEITLELNGVYLTRGGTEVTLESYNSTYVNYPFIGDNGCYYQEKGNVYTDRPSRKDIVSKVPQVRYSQASHEYYKGLSDGKSRASTFSTSELQSLITLNSKAIRSLEQEITELKELTKDLGLIVHHHWKVIDLRKSLYNQLSSKQKRLSKLVAVQIRMKRVK